MKFLERRRGLVEDRLEAVLEDVEPTELSEEVQQVTLSGGKRVRPLVTVLACEAAGGVAEDAVDFGVGIELVHNASLVVDDVIDQSEMRRGVESAWTAHGYGPAIVASDGLLGEAFELFSDEPRAMQAATEAMIELGEGEATELVAQPTNEEEYMQLARRKTGALFRAAAELGAIAAGADPFDVEAFGEYAERMGVAFQIRDDVLDATADSEALGKPAGIDEAMDRPSIVRVTDRSPDELNGLAREQSDRALGALADLDLPAGEAKDYLEHLAEFVVERDA